MIAAMMPTFGRPILLASAIAQFERQTYPDKRLIALDDSGLLPSTVGKDWALVSIAEKTPTLVQKYQRLVEIATTLWPEWDALALMDDDDVYAAWWLESHAAALEHRGWSHPDRVWSLHSPPAESKTQPGQEGGRGRFWASGAVRRDWLESQGGFVDSRDVAYDQHHMGRWYGAEEPGIPEQAMPGRPPAYVYGWGRSNHCSTGTHEGWYDWHRPMCVGPVGAIVPQLDQQAAAVLEFIERYVRCWS